MKLVAYDTGQTLFMILLDEARPLSGVYLPDLIKEVGERYALALKSTDLAEAIKSGVKYQVGRLSEENKTIAIKQLDLYNDGILITTCSTDDTETVFSDLSAWLKSNFGFRDPVTSIRRKYFSSVVVDFDKPLERLLSAFSEITSDYATMLKSHNNVDASPSLYRIALSADPRELPQFTQTQFLIERRNDAAFSLNRYIATAPLASDKLLSLLERLEGRL
jgi:hypothetical protein